MGMVRCSKCKQMYAVTGVPTGICPACTAKREAMLTQVREMVKSNPGISPQTVSKQTGVPVQVVIKYISGEA